MVSAYNKMSDGVHWKAHKWSIFLLFYSLQPCLNFFTRKYVKHWDLSVDGISILLKVSIKSIDIEFSRTCLTEFIHGVEELYGREHVSFNVHLLAHLPESVINWGPLWIQSAFLYENANQLLLSYVKSSNGVANQICDTFRLQSVVERLSTLCSQIMLDPQKIYLDSLLNKEKKPKPSLVLANTLVLGAASNIDKLTRQQFLALQRMNVNIDKHSVIQSYKRVIVNRKLVHSKQYSKVEKRASYYVLLHNSQIFEIDLNLAIKTNDNECAYALGRYFKRKNTALTQHRRLEHLIVLDKRDELLACISTSEIKEKVTLIEMSDSSILIACMHPNHFELVT